MSKLLRIIAYPNPSASRIYRLEQVARYINKLPGYEYLISPNGVNDDELLWADIVVCQGQINPHMIADLWAYKMERGLKIVVDRDDILQVQPDNPFAKMHKQLDALVWSRELVKIADLVTVTTKPIAEECQALNEHVALLPNYLDLKTWDIPTAPNETGMLRVGWSGSITHRDDLKLVLPTLKRLVHDRPQVKLVFCGDYTISRELMELPRERYELVGGTGPDFHVWPTLAHTLSYDIGVAPLVNSPFNRARSPLKYLEYGMIRAAGIYSPTAYDGTVKDAETGLIAETAVDWYAKLITLVDNKDFRDRIIRNAYQDVRDHYSIANHITDWVRLYRALQVGTAARRIAKRSGHTRRAA